MSGETKLNEFLRTLSAQLVEGVYVVRNTAGRFNASMTPLEDTSHLDERHPVADRRHDAHRCERGGFRVPRQRLTVNSEL